MDTKRTARVLVVTGTVGGLVYILELILRIIF